MTSPVFLLTDFGTDDTYVGVVKAVILGIAPAAPLVDLTHAIPPQDVRSGAFALLTAMPYLPDGAVVLAVVDPGVGTGRRPVAVRVAGRTLVGPDNGLLSWAVAAGRLASPTEVATLPAPGIAAAAVVDRRPAGDRLPIGDGVEAVTLDRPEHWLARVSTTFHGRDIFGPVAARLARGIPLAAVGSPIGELVALPFPAVRRDRAGDGNAAVVRGEVVHVDRYGNLITNLAPADLPPAPRIALGRVVIDGVVTNYQAGAGPLLALVGSSGFVEIAAPNGSAARHTGAGVGAPVSATSRDV